MLIKHFLSKKNEEVVYIINGEVVSREVYDYTLQLIDRLQTKFNGEIDTWNTSTLNDSYDTPEFRVDFYTYNTEGQKDVMVDRMWFKKLVK